MFFFSSASFNKINIEVNIWIYFLFYLKFRTSVIFFKSKKKFLIFEQNFLGLFGLKFLHIINNIKWMFIDYS